MYYNDARFLRLVILEQPDEILKIGSEIDDDILKKYEELVNLQLK